MLLISASFLASRYCYGVEMRRAMERHAAGEATVIPVIVRPCHWQSSPFGSLLAVPLGPRAVGWLESDVSEWIAGRVKIARDGTRQMA